MNSSLIILCVLLILIAMPVRSEQFEASFRNTEMSEFINIASKNLKKTIILDPSVKGNITIRSHEMLDEQQYYQFFLSVLDVYGFAVLNMNNGVLKVVPATNAKSGVIPLSRDGDIRAGDELITRVIHLKYVTAKELAPLLRQLNDASSGSVVHYNPSNVLLMTGRAAVIEELAAIVDSIDQSDEHSLDKLQLENASASQIAALLNTLQSNGNKPSAKAVADRRTNALLVSGAASARQTMLSTARDLDQKQMRQGNAKVIYLKHAKADNLLDVLTGINSGSDVQNSNETSASTISVMKDVVVKADKHTNSLVINASPELLSELEQVIQQLDIERAQVLVEAIIVEVLDADGLALGVQWSQSATGPSTFQKVGLLYQAGFPVELAKMLHAQVG